MHIYIYYQDCRTTVIHCFNIFMFFPNILSRLQHVLNTIARIVTLSMKHEHITPNLYMLHWLPVEQQLHFKLLLTTFKALHGQAPDYIRHLLVKSIEECFEQ